MNKVVTVLIEKWHHHLFENFPILYLKSLFPPLRFPLPPSSVRFQILIELDSNHTNKKFVSICFLVLLFGLAVILKLEDDGW
ncbi:hypothetical protein NE237_014200 [Protea cynaroides]|uniref:Transmembrane protein n=1 Tax=Protea cynaroides TaxID=273540 RepID=A0A9Q0JT63_9MAGN|nr:hypothetical protein NE237_014200 [Protea cynaroides]